jgi:hypothetical protein
MWDSSGVIQFVIGRSGAARAFTAHDLVGASHEP